MKIINKIIVFTLAIIFVSACEQDYIDPISRVDPGTDEAAPVALITYPRDGDFIKVQNGKDWSILFKVEDDIELASVSVKIDGTEIGSITEFKDYRRYSLPFLYNDITDGDHILEIVATDLSGKTTTSALVNFKFLWIEAYVPFMDEVFQMSFEGTSYKDFVSYEDAVVVGSPSFATGLAGSQAYQGVADAYLTWPIDGFTSGEGFSASFWMQIGAASRSGILTVSPPDASNNLRTSGFRFFREAVGDMQRFKLNVGIGTGEAWFDGNTAADVAPNTGEWVHFAFSIGTTVNVYIDGTVVSTGEIDGISWDNCSSLSIMSGAPNFTGWDHFSDDGTMDELYIFDRPITAEEVQSLIDAGNMK
jgi:hypothetical protein